MLLATLVEGRAVAAGDLAQCADSVVAQIGMMESGSSLHFGAQFVRGTCGRVRTENLWMRISFDIDDTLVCSPGVPTEQHLSRWWRLWYAERLRSGT